MRRRGTTITSLYRGAAWPLLLVALALAAACSVGGSAPAAPASVTPSIPAATATGTATARPTASPIPSATPTRGAGATATASTTPLAQQPDIVRRAVTMLANDLNLPPEQVQVVRVETRDWPTTSLGCPEPGKAYLDVITPGYIVLLAARGQEYELHTDRSKLIVRCGGGAATPARQSAGTPPAAGTPGATPATGATPLAAYPPVAQLAVVDLANALGLRPEEIAVVAVEEQDWPDSSLGCPEPGRSYLQVITPGYRVILAAGGQRYEYHTDRQNIAVRCPR